MPIECVPASIPITPEGEVPATIAMTPMDQVPAISHGTHRRRGMFDKVRPIIDDALDAGLDLPAACAKALEWINRNGLIEDLVATYGTRLLSDLYRTGMASASWTPPGSEKASASAVNAGAAVFREYEAVVGKRIGDCRLADIRTLAAHRHGLAKANEAAAAVFDAIAKEMERTRSATVASCYKNRYEEFRQLYKRAGTPDA
jgi:hypothetical protein